jgi:hypothetical protein
VAGITPHALCVECDVRGEEHSALLRAVAGVTPHALSGPAHEAACLRSRLSASAAATRGKTACSRRRAATWSEPAAAAQLGCLSRVELNQALVLMRQHKGVQHNQLRSTCKGGAYALMADHLLASFPRSWSVSVYSSVSTYPSTLSPELLVSELEHNNLGSPGAMFGSAGVPTCPAGYTGDGSRADSGIPPAPLTHSHAQLDTPETAHGPTLENHQLLSLTHTPSWIHRRRLTGRLCNATSCLTVAPLTHSHAQLDTLSSG